MARVQVTGGFLLDDQVGDVHEAREYEDIWYVEGIGGFLKSEVLDLGKHGSHYDPNHWGELDPDAYDRLGYVNPHDGTEDDYAPHGRHLLDSGVN